MSVIRTKNGWRITDPNSKKSKMKRDLERLMKKEKAEQKPEDIKKLEKEIEELENKYKDIRKRRGRLKGIIKFIHHSKFKKEEYKLYTKLLVSKDRLAKRMEEFEEYGI